MRRKRRTVAPHGAPVGYRISASGNFDEPVANGMTHADMPPPETRSVLQSEGLSVSAEQTRETRPIIVPEVEVERAVALASKRRPEAAPPSVAPLETGTFVARRSLFSDDLVEEAKRYFSSRQGAPVSDDLARNYLGSLVDFVLLFKQ